jgi:dihydrolipoamide dehydrogenase
MSEFDLIVIGAGPGGYVAAIRAAQLGMKVACVEKEPRLGGTCLRVGCIPSKALLESSEQYHRAKGVLADHGVKTGDVELDLKTMLNRKSKIVADLTAGIDGLLKKNKITRVLGHAGFAAADRLDIRGDDGDQQLTAKHVIIATGSNSAELPGVELDYDRIGTSTEALDYPMVPKHLVVIGAGAIGLELGSVWRRLGAEVTVLEYLDRILPGMDLQLAKEALKILKSQGLQFHLGARVTSAKKKGKGCVVAYEGGAPIECDRVLLAVGRTPNTDGLGLDKVGIVTDKRGRIEVDAHYRTGVAGVYAIGDVIAGPMLAHKAEDEGMACAEHIVTGHGHVNYDAIPAIVYTDPEVAAVGKTEEELKDAGVEYNAGSFQFRGNGRARVIGSVDGRVKVLADAKTDRILGVHIIGPRAGDLIAEAAVAIEFGASAEDLARSCHAHPTLAEAVREAALAVDKRAIHA